MSDTIANPQIMVVKEGKSRTVAFLLSFFFGPLGMLYSTVPGALIMLVAGSILMLVSFGLAIFIVWPVCIVWAVMAAKPTRYMASADPATPNG